ncbi:HET-domain-containing protein [Corynespora cassiicola Philippines]|uniref:HET-domain-containing protein n=1 Tax=Corynespora cassiicola Philippines TaxID=1448308 RepID=A0A2T2N8K1_CORCC|nr:HET-domain-containing protein [Corynespora cassiicola Philippines]
MEEFQYDPLDLGRRSIRILRLFAGSRSYIECEIFEARLFQEDCVPFEALSYVWGSLEKSYSIQLNGKRLAVTKNLYVALQHMRFKKKDRILWIDAICIDQNNAKERGHQVQQMGDIFSQAEQVIFWLGHSTLDVGLLMAALKRLERSSHENFCNGWLLSDKRWLQLWSETQFPLTEVVSMRMRQGLQELFQRPWFTRVWILQEVAKAKRAVVCAGNEMVGSRIFTLAPTLVNVHPDMHCQAVLDIMPGQSRRSSWWSEKRNLCTLLQKFPRSRASDSRDRIFALIGIASDGEENHLLKPDYTKPVEELIRDAELFFFGKVRGGVAHHGYGDDSNNRKQRESKRDDVFP